MPDIIITPSSGIIDFFPVSTRVSRIDGSGNILNIVNPSGYIAASGSGLSINSSTPNATLFAYSSTSGATILNIEGTNGSLFSVVDNLSGSLMSVNNNAGLPVFEVFSDDRIVAGRFGQNDFIMTSGGNIGIGTGIPSSKFHVVGTSTFGGDISSTGSLIIGSGTAALPSIEFVGDPDTGLFSAGANTIGISTSGSERLRIDNTGNVGIGTTTPSGRLDVAGDVYVRGTGNNLGTVYFKSQAIGDKSLYVSATNGGDLVVNGGGPNIQLSSQGGYLNLLGMSTQIHIGHGYNAGNTSQTIRFLPAATEMMRMTTSGTIGIGLPTTNTSYAGNSVKLFTNQPYANTRVHIAGSGSDSSSAALIVTNSGNSPLLYARNDGRVGVLTSSPEYVLDVNGNLRSSESVTSRQAYTPYNYNSFAFVDGNDSSLLYGTIVFTGLAGVEYITALPDSTYSYPGEIKILHNMDAAYDIVLVNRSTYNNGSIYTGTNLDYTLGDRQSVILQFIYDSEYDIYVWKIIGCCSGPGIY